MIEILILLLWFTLGLAAVRVAAALVGKGFDKFREYQNNRALRKR